MQDPAHSPWRLALDIGNTRTKAGLFRPDGTLAHVAHFANSDAGAAPRLWAEWGIGSACICATGEDQAGWQGFCEARVPTLLLSHLTPLPFRSAYQTPDTLGRDRLAAVAGAQALFPGAACLVVDAGTCITYDLLDAAGLHRGGNISPGLAMRFRAMHHFTAKLPLLGKQRLDTAYGLSTASAMQVGAQQGLLHEVEGFIGSYRALLGEEMRVLLAGGDADFLAEHLKTKIFVNENLVLIGLNKIAMYNAA